MFLKPAVLPSNAPPLEENGVYQASRVLQEHSGNRQQSALVVHGSDQKASSTASIENSWSSQHVQQLGVATGNHYYHLPTSYRQSSLPYGSAPLHSRYFIHSEEEKITRQAKHLWQRFQASPAYKKYRGRQHKDDKGNTEQKWPDHLEEAFFRALVMYPPMGRRKKMHKQKQRGRNELIADHIEELTGEGRTRKQVSSHIQVLKPFVEHDPQIMLWLSKEDMGLQPGGGRHFSGRHGSGYMSGRRASTYHPVATGASRSSISSSQHPPIDLNAIRAHKHSLDIFQPTKFEIFVQRKYANGDEILDERLHTYTQAVELPLAPDTHVPDWQTFEEQYPYLASMHRERKLDCNILVAQASLGFPMEEFRHKAEMIELGISYICSSDILNPSTRVRCRNSFWRDGQLVGEHEKDGPSGVFDVPFQQDSANEASIAPLIKFGSTFWAGALSTFGTKLKKAIEGGRDVREEVKEIILWRFRLSTTTTGRASWSKLVLPSGTLSQYPEPKAERVDSMYDYVTQYNEPLSGVSQVPPTLQSPFEYDTNSGSGSALSSATWPATISDNTAQVANDLDFSVDNAFNFDSGNINLSFDPNFDFNSLDSSAFNFDAGAAAAAAAFPQDPALDQYSLPPQQWPTTYIDHFDTQQDVSAEASFADASAAKLSQSYPYNHYEQRDSQAYESQPDHQHQHHHPSQSEGVYGGGDHDPRTYPTNPQTQDVFGGGGDDDEHVSHVGHGYGQIFPRGGGGGAGGIHDQQQQAFGGAAGLLEEEAEEEMKQEDEEALAVLADGSYFAPAAAGGRSSYS
ncbi:hypothetical protein KC337_g16009 [Hortaea werneckii]|uniref:TEA domain-containing protein n=1 Tax=Hortaea werneckii EXF-2000 TaxID=1157616 RepID=A0A1Z5TBS0_HORWE|nr:hypothetical protein KC350_g15987 [Hortaea werneckii]KAI7117210.1 hypothetical protein KC337_g16009 [Hortaea werneckii]KAI7471936.1 hypothetical protein KC364_g6422 [Hortaea werneckii]OTA33453.1 hypothetical protein BTJ68_05665 [Hortaea werneckii EXF-2000]